MTLLYTITEKDTQGKNRVFNYYSCNTCESKYRKQKRFEGSTQEHYCSKTCYTKQNNNHVTLICAHCGIEFSRKASYVNNSKSGLYFCCREHKDIGQTYIKDIQPDHYGTGSGEYSYRDKAFREYGKVCSRCGYNNSLALEVHHKDKNRKNNDISNLEVLCANCHTIEHKLRG